MKVFYVYQMENGHILLEQSTHFRKHITIRSGSLLGCIFSVAELVPGIIGLTRATEVLWTRTAILEQVDLTYLSAIEIEQVQQCAYGEGGGGAC